MAAPAAPGLTALATATVSSCADDGTGTLRAAVATKAATIDMTALPCSTITLTTGAIVVADDVTTMAFNGPTGHPLTIDANHDSRILLHKGNATLTFDHVRLTNGTYSSTLDGAGGACVYATGPVTLKDASISNCQLSSGIGAFGGAIYANQLTLTDSTLSGSIAQGPAVYGGGAFTRKLTMTRSTIRDNTTLATETTSTGGGAFVNFGNTRLYASTISGNYAEYEGGLAATSNASIYNSTISGNTASVAGAMSVTGLLVLDNSTVASNTNTSQFFGSIYVKGGVVAHSSIVANNCYVGQHCDIQCKNCTIVGSHNLIQGANVALPGDTIQIDPILGPLTDNGGPTKTHAVLPTSPALETGSNIHDYPLDQRGRIRTFGTAPDIGAFEAGSDAIFADGFD